MDLPSPPKDAEERFIRTLEKRFQEPPEGGDGKEGFDRPGRAVLRRHAGKTLSDSPRAMHAFYRLHPPTGYGKEDRAFILATLYCLARGRARIGQSLARALRSLESDGYSLPGLERRFVHLLDSTEMAELAFRLGQIVKLLAANRKGLDWVQLLRDLNQWSREDRNRQKQWARDFYLFEETKTTDRED